MTKISINNHNSKTVSGSLFSQDIENLKIVCDTSKGKQNVTVYIDGKTIFSKDFQ